jgi:thioredoxin-dependent peroxiredoxin
MRHLAMARISVAVVLAFASASARALEVGDKAPAFTLPATTTEKLSLADYLGKKNVVLFGFIGAFTPT